MDVVVFRKSFPTNTKEKVEKLTTTTRHCIGHALLFMDREILRFGFGMAALMS
jgi:hypothetical protein